ASPLWGVPYRHLCQPGRQATAARRPCGTLRDESLCRLDRECVADDVPGGEPESIVANHRPLVANAVTEPPPTVETPDASGSVDQKTGRRVRKARSECRT